MKARFLALIGLLLLLTAQPTQAEDKRISLQVGPGVSFLPNPLPHVQLWLSYRLPMLEDRLDVFLTSTHAPLLFTLEIDQLFVGGKYYFLTDGWLRPHTLAGLGVVPLRQRAFSLLGGLGVDLMLADWFGIALTFSGALPPLNPNLLVLNLDASLKFNF